MRDITNRKMKVRIGYGAMSLSLSEQLESQGLRYKKDTTILQRNLFQKHIEMITSLHLHRYISDSENKKIGDRFVKKFLNYIEEISLPPELSEDNQ